MFQPQHYLRIDKIVDHNTALVTLKMTRRSRLKRTALILVPWGLIVAAAHVALNTAPTAEPLTEDTDVPFPQHN